MPRFSLGTLILLMLLGGPVCAVAWWFYSRGGPPYSFLAMTVLVTYLVGTELLTSRLGWRITRED